MELVNFSLHRSTEQNLESSLSPPLELMNTRCGIDDYRTWNMLLAWN
jgi:hypothetical protein